MPHVGDEELYSDFDLHVCALHFLNGSHLCSNLSLCLVTFTNF